MVLSSEERDGLDEIYKNKYWKVSYGLTKDDIKTDDKRFTITYKIIDGNVFIHKLSYRELNDFVNNPIVITEAEAIKIAIDKEKEFSALEILKCEAELGVKKMNSFVFLLENKLNNMNENIHIDNIERNVWIVSIEHKKENKPRSEDILIARKEFNKRYYIDATTGEIIGGEEAEYSFE